LRVLIPTPLRSYTGKAAAVSAHGATLDQLVSDLDRQYPGLRFRIIDEQGSIRPHVRFFVNKLATRDLASALSENDEVMIVGALSGG
jgi:molybdopterin converting factor small subunit